MRTDEVTENVIGAAMKVHRELGPGLLESTYETCLAAEMADWGLSFVRQCTLPVRYKDLYIETAYRVDFVVEEQVVVELKSVAAIAPVHLAQLLTYLKLSGCRAGLLLNFNVAVLKHGIRRLIR